MPLPITGTRPASVGNVSACAWLCVATLRGRSAAARRIASSITLLNVAMLTRWASGVVAKNGVR